MISLNPYLGFNGNCEEAFAAYTKILGGKLGYTTRFDDMPPEAGGGNPAMKGKIAHTRMTLGAFTLMGSDAPPERYKAPQGFSVNITVDDPAEADRIFAALAEGGATIMPIQETFWAVRFGMCADRFGIHWMVNCEKQMPA
jgi:PhnB protein